MKQSHREEKLKDRRDYRAVLIERRESVERKIAKTEAEISEVKK